MTFIQHSQGLAGVVARYLPRRCEGFCHRNFDVALD